MIRIERQQGTRDTHLSTHVMYVSSSSYEMHVSSGHGLIWGHGLGVHGIYTKKKAPEEIR
jgi:hypothetical protein